MDLSGDVRQKLAVLEPVFLDVGVSFEACLNRQEECCYCGFFHAARGGLFRCFNPFATAV
ncbi:MAG TPA: hypothetical protein DEO64_04895 [Alcaligenes faecalis]|nr:hypothetical protein [Alcaligenes faecalis]